MKNQSSWRRTIMSLEQTLIYSASVSVGSTILALGGAYIGSRLVWKLKGRPPPRAMNSSDMGDSEGMTEVIERLLLAEGIATTVTFAVSSSWFSWPSLLLVPALKVVQYFILLNL